MAKTLDTKLEALILDEPTRGIDVSTQTGNISFPKLLCRRRDLVHFHFIGNGRAY